MGSASMPKLPGVAEAIDGAIDRDQRRGADSRERAADNNRWSEIVGLGNQQRPDAVKAG